MGAQSCKQSTAAGTTSSPEGKNENEHILYLPRDEDWPWVWAIRDDELLDWRESCPSEERPQAVARGQPRLPVYIHEKLYLGNAACVTDINRLQDLGVTGVLNVAGPLALAKKTIQALKRNNIEYHSTEAKDEHHYPFLSEHWEGVLQFIQKMTLAPNSKLVVHCQAGFNRAGLVVTSYHMILTRTTVLEAVQHLRKQRGNSALRNPGYQEQLVALARENELLGSAPGTPGSILHQAEPPKSESNWWITPDRR